MEEKDKKLETAETPVEETVPAEVVEESVGQEESAETQIAEAEVVTEGSAPEAEIAAYSSRSLTLMCSSLGR